jgi:hypothetical protein
MPAYTSQHERLERQTAIAHQWVHKAWGAAEAAGEDDVAADLRSILHTLTGIGERLVDDRRKRGRRARAGTS